MKVQSEVRSLPILDLGRPLDNTAMSAYMACPKEYQYAMEEHRRGRGRSAALVYGAAWHKVMEYHYKTGGNTDLAVIAAQKSWEDHGDPTDHRTIERLALDYLGYVKHYGHPQKEQGRTVGFPDAPLVEISVNAVIGGLQAAYAGKLDRIIELGGLHYVEDHKTTSRLDRHFFTQFKNSNQMMGYVYTAKHLFPDLKIAGVRINVNHLLKGGSAFHRHIETFAPAQLEAWADNTNNWIRRIHASRQTSDWPMHFGDNGCSRKFGMCQYHNVCSASPRVRERLLEQEFDIVPWNPLAVEDEA